MNPEILIIASDKELYQEVLEVGREFEENFLTVHKYLDDAIDIAYQMLDKGVKVIVARGGTAVALRQANLPVPIVEIPITEFEVLHLLAQARKISSKIAIVAFSGSLIKGGEIANSIFNLDIHTFTVHSETDVKIQVQRAKNMGIEVIIGAKLAAECATSLGLKSILLVTPKYVVQESLNEAIKVLNAIRCERERLSTIFDSIKEGIILVDENAKINLTNTIANKIINTSEVIDKANLPATIFSKSTVSESVINEHKIVGEIRNFHGIKYVVNLTPTTIDNNHRGAIITFQELKQLQKLEQNTRYNLYNKGHVATFYFHDVLTSDPAMKKLIILAQSYAKTDSTIFINGDSGTGKEMFAQSLHNASQRKSGPFVAINCAALPEHLLESELFGYVEGAFTGAKKGGKIGLFELAHGGTLFLDEISEISLAVQARLLRVLEQRKIMRIGDDTVTPVDVRIICATNKDLKLMIKNNKFREDLYYRINILKIKLPALCNRKEDIPILFDHFLQGFSKSLKLKPPSIDPEARTLLQNYSWPGNIRELRNTAERLIIGAVDGRISYHDLSNLLDETSCEANIVQNKPVSAGRHISSLRDQEEMKLILRVLENTGGNKAMAARQLGISKSTLWRRLKNINYESAMLELLSRID